MKSETSFSIFVNSKEDKDFNSLTYKLGVLDAEKDLKKSRACDFSHVS